MSAVRAYVGVTDDNWYQFLAPRPLMNEVNFWQPRRNREFRVLASGEPFFKTHRPHVKVVGGGFSATDQAADWPGSVSWSLLRSSSILWPRTVTTMLAASAPVAVR